jgi:hypothetical protein
VKVELTNEEVNTIVTALVRMPWIDVNDVITKLTEPTPQHVSIDTPMLTLPVVDSMNAPYGLKKDGTPAKRRGRPAVKKTRKARQ